MILSILTTIFGVVMSLAYFPQAYQIWKTKSGKSISLVSYAIFGTGTILFTAYGLQQHDYVLVFSFALGMIGAWLCFGLALRYRHQ
jgi:MtN3 and saliva related transmembrane protein